MAKWAAELAHQGWPGCDTVFAWSFYSQGTREQLAASSDLFLKEALTFFGDAEVANSAQGAFDKGRRLAQLVGERRSLLILDGLEPLQYAPTSPTPGELKDQGVSALLKGLAATSSGLCVVTTRYSIHELRGVTTAPEVKLLRLSRDAGVHLLKTLGVKGSERRNLALTDGDPNSEKVDEFEKLVEDVKGHALTLNLLGSYLSEFHAGDIRKRDLVNLKDADDEEGAGHAFRVMDAYVHSLATGARNEAENEKGKVALELLRLLGLFDRPATADCLGALWKKPAILGLTEQLVELDEPHRNKALKRLEVAKLLTVNRDASGALLSLDAHPHLREYFAAQLKEKQPESWREAHSRLYEHLCETTNEGDEPTLEDLQPLYQAVAHGCQAGLQRESWKEVYFARIRKGNKYYSAKKLGAFGSELGAVACFFEIPWRYVSKSLDEPTQALALNAAASWLRALGRLTEALEPMRVSGEMDVKVEEWNGAAISHINLSELELTLGEVAGALEDASRSVTYADRSGDAEWQNYIRARTTHADALHQAGRRAEALERFREAEQMQAKSQPDYPLLYSVGGFHYCDLLLAEAERAAWRERLETGDPRREVKTELIDVCHEVEQRAEQTLQWVRDAKMSLLTIALDHLTMGRAALYAAILESPDSAFRIPHSELDLAVSGLRRAGVQDYLNRGLLTRAWLRHLSGAQTGALSAQEDLDEAWEIAERGSMKLHLADIYLSRARLFGIPNVEFRMPNEGTAKAASYPWESPAADLAAAEDLIKKCGYHRRDEELADAKAALDSQVSRQESKSN